METKTLFMENENRIVELLAEMLIRQDRTVDELRNVKFEVVGIRDQVKETNQRLDQTNQRLDQTNQRLDQTIERLDRFERNTEEQLIKLNIQTVENSRAIFKLAENVKEIANLHDRVWNLEKAVYK
jgi:hypothetical protein